MQNISYIQTQNDRVIYQIRGNTTGYEEKDVTDDFDSGKLSTDIANENFSNYSYGNYIKKNVSGIGEVKLVFADFDTFYRGYNLAACVTTHHIGVLAFGLGTHYMNSSNSTSGGYAGSAMNSWLSDTIFPKISSTFGSKHFLKHRKLFSTSISEWGWGWYDSYISLMTEMQLYGARIFSCNAMQGGEAIKQLGIFQIQSLFNVFGNKADGQSLGSIHPDTYWLRDCFDGSHFCSFHVAGAAFADYALEQSSAVPLLLLT